MTGKEAIKILMNAYENLVKLDGRGSSKTNFRIALLIGANSIGALEQIDEGNLVRVTKCKDCRFHHCSERNLWCDIFDKIMPEDGYCCFGEIDIYEL